ncbi:hypothetical protein ACS0TY_027018 [Phlomoides rotata]
MALSWNELRDDHKIVVLLETLENEKDQQALIACRFCDEIFFDNKSLLNHFQSHFHRDGACNGRILAGSSVPPENSSNSISRSSECTHSSNMPNLSLGKSSVPSFSQIVQLRRGSTLTDHIFASQPNWSLNFNSRFTSEPTGPLDLRSPIRLTSADIFTSDTTTRSTSNFPTAPGTSTSQSIRQLNHEDLCETGLPYTTNVIAAIVLVFTSNNISSVLCMVNQFHIKKTVLNPLLIHNI